MAMRIESLRKFYTEELRDIYDAEHQILEALPMMEEKASAPELKNAFQQHFDQTTAHVSRLERIFRSLGIHADRKTCKGMKGLLAEGNEYVKARGDDDTIDAALIAAAQRVEHYEMAVYGTLCAYAQTLGHTDHVELLQRTLDEEKSTDEKLSEIAEAEVNELAAIPAPKEGLGERVADAVRNVF
jgi:ferritin-like metal-binding protein YciE